MAKFLKCSILFLSLLPVVLPCIYASELFFFDGSKEKDDGAAKLTEVKNGRVKNIAVNLEESVESQKVRRIFSLHVF